MRFATGAAAIATAVALGSPATAAATPLPADTEVTQSDGLYWVLVPEIGDSPLLFGSPHFTASQEQVATRYGSRKPPPGDDKHCKPDPDYTEPLCFFGTPFDHQPASREEYDAGAERPGWPNADLTAATNGLRVRNNTIVPFFACNALLGCSSTLTLTTTGKVQVPGEKSKRVVLLAKGPLSAGAHPIKLSSAAAKLLKRDRRIHARSTIVTTFTWEQVSKTTKRNIGLFAGH